MDFKRMLPVMLIAFVLIMGWPIAMTWFGKQMGWDLTPPKPDATSTVATNTTSPTGTSTTAPASTTVDPATGALIPAPAPTGIPAVPGDPASATTATSASGITIAPAHLTAGPTDGSDLVKLGSDSPADPNYAMLLSINPRGAGLDAVSLNAYRQTLKTQDRYTFARPLSAFEDITRVFSTRAIIVDGQRIETASVRWTPVPASSPARGRAATFSLDLLRDGQPFITVIKQFLLFERTHNPLDPNTKPGEGPEGYEIFVQHQIKNQTKDDRATNVNVAIVMAGPQTPPSETERAIDAYLQVGTERIDRPDLRDTEIHAIGSINKAQNEPINLLDLPGKRPLYIGATTTYFAAMVRPIDRKGRFAPDVLDSIRAYSVNPQARSFERQIVVPIQTKPQTIAAGASGAIDFAAYLGPRKREILANPYYTALSLDKTLVIAFGPCAFCTFDGLIRVLFAVLKFFHSIVGDWGLSIILLVCLVRGLLHPITKWSQMNMLKLGKLGPEMKKLQEKYKGDKEGMARAQMELMKQQGATPVMGCLPMFLQMPIWIALWQALNTTFDLRHQPFLYGVTWIDDLSKPDHLIDFANFGWPTLHLLWGMLTISGLNILPLILAVIFYIQIKIQPQPANLSPEQEQQQKIMKWMMIGLFPIFLYGSPSGLCIYIITSTIIGIIESKRIRKQFERKEEEAKRLALVDGATPSLQRQPAKPKKGLAAWLERVQNQAMEMQKQAEAAKKQQQNRKK